MTTNPINHDVAAWMTRIAAALAEIGDHKSGHGEYYAEVVVKFDGESTGWRVIADEHGGFALDIDTE